MNDSHETDNFWALGGFGLFGGVIIGLSVTICTIIGAFNGGGDGAIVGFVIGVAFGIFLIVEIMVLYFVVVVSSDWEATGLHAFFWSIGADESGGELPWDGHLRSGFEVGSIIGGIIGMLGGSILGFIIGGGIEVGPINGEVIGGLGIFYGFGIGTIIGAIVGGLLVMTVLIAVFSVFELIRGFFQRRRRLGQRQEVHREG